MSGSDSLVLQVQELFARQEKVWPQLRAGIEGLAAAKTRTVRIDWFEVVVRHIPHRMTSTTAAVDADSVARRPCFLCARNLPAEEEGLRFDDDYTIYCNPFPIVTHHLTIAHREHRPQRIAGSIGTMLDLAAALPGYFIIYNGPECGASAPDHMHFQAGSRELFPIEKDSQSSAMNVPGYKRHVLIFRGSERSSLAERIDRAIEVLADKTRRPGEPMVNLAVFRKGQEWTAYLFPRGKHRPEVFYTGELTVSPASIDLCGVFVVPSLSDFERIDGAAIAQIFREIALPDDLFEQVVGTLEDAR